MCKKGDLPDRQERVYNVFLIIEFIICRRFGEKMHCLCRHV